MVLTPFVLRVSATLGGRDVYGLTESSAIFEEADLLVDRRTALRALVMVIPE